MAIYFTSYDTGEQFLIGGQGSSGGLSGNIGPMARYNISRSDLSTGDGTYLGSKYTINITGTATLAVQGDITTTGDAHDKVQSVQKTNLSFNRIQSAFGNGRLEISPYGGMPNTIQFSDARLTSLELSEQDDASSGTQYVEYSFVFDAFVESSNSTNSNWGQSAVQPTYYLESANESWSLAVNDGQFSYKSGRIDQPGNKFKTYTLTHTLSAKGYRKYSNDTLDSQDGHAWAQAARWINDRLSVTESPDADINSNALLNGDDIVTTFNAMDMSKSGETTLVDLRTEAFKPVNKVRTIQTDLAGGSYTVTDSFLLTQEETFGTHEVQVSLDGPVEANEIVVSVQGTVSGFNTLDADYKTDNKYANALIEYNRLINNSSILSTFVGLLSTDAYNRFVSAANKTGSLQNIKSFTETHDKIAGTIGWNLSLTDQETDIVGAVQQTVKYSYTNDEVGRFSVQNPNAIAVVANGPYLYNPGITPEKKLSINVEVIMGGNYRSSMPNGMVATGSPAMNWNQVAPILTSKQESWNPKTGQYSLNIEYTYV